MSIDAKNKTEAVLHGDIAEATSNLADAIGEVEDVIDTLKGRLDPCLAGLVDPSGESVTKEEMGRSPLANELNRQAGRVRATRLQLERLCEAIQL